MTFHVLMIYASGILVSTTAFSGEMQCGQAMPSVVAALEPSYGNLNAYCEDTGVPTVRPEARPL